MLRNGIGGSMPAKYKTIELEGDLDLFGDHSVEIHRTVSHTPGSQMVVVRLPKSGTAVLTSDAVYLQENLDKNILPSIGSVYNPPGMLDAYAWVRRVRDTEGASVFMAHDPTPSRRRSTRRNSTNKQPTDRSLDAANPGHTPGFACCFSLCGRAEHPIAC